MYARLNIPHLQIIDMAKDSPLLPPASLPPKDPAAEGEISDSLSNLMSDLGNMLSPKGSSSKDVSTLKAVDIREHNQQLHARVQELEKELEVWRYIEFFLKKLGKRKSAASSHGISKSTLGRDTGIIFTGFILDGTGITRNQTQGTDC